MIPCSNRVEVGLLGGGAGVGFPPGRTSDGRRRGQGRFRSKLYKNKRQRLGFGVVNFRGCNITTS